MTRMEELESCLSGLLSTLKKNREHVPLEVLKTQYKQPYEELVRNINLTASAYAKSVLLHRLVLNPDADVDEQCTVINQMISFLSFPNTSGIKLLQNVIFSFGYSFFVRCNSYLSYFSF